MWFSKVEREVGSEFPSFEEFSLKRDYREQKELSDVSVIHGLGGLLSIPRRYLAAHESHSIQERATQSSYTYGGRLFHCDAIRWSQL